MPLKRSESLGVVARNASDMNLLTTDIDSYFVHSAACLSNELELGIQGNVLLTKECLNFCVFHGIKNFIYLSTGSVYGNCVGKYYTEQDIPEPKTFYALTKYMGELLSTTYAAQHSILPQILRIYFPFGGYNEKSIFSKIKKNISLERKSLLNLRGAPFFRPLHISDLCEAILSLIYKIKRKDLTEAEIFNLCGDVEINISSILTYYSRTLSCETNFIKTILDPGDHLASNQKIKDFLGWAPRKELYSFLI